MPLPSGVGDTSGPTRQTFELALIFSVVKNAAPEVVIEDCGRGFGEVWVKRGRPQEVYEVLLPLPARGFIGAFSELLQCFNQQAVQCEHCKSGEIVLVNRFDRIKESGVQAVFQYAPKLEAEVEVGVLLTVAERSLADTLLLSTVHLLFLK